MVKKSRLRLRSKILLARSSKRRRSSNFWYLDGRNTYSKIVLRDAERIWIETMLPDLTLSLERVPGCENMPSFQRGEWDGMAHFLRFKPNDARTFEFRQAWW